MARKAEVMVANGEGLSVADAAAAKKVVAAAGAAAMEQVVTAAAAKGEEADVEVARAGISVVAVEIVAKGVEEMVARDRHQINLQNLSVPSPLPSVFFPP